MEAAKVEVRAATRTLSNLISALINSSAKPTQKYSLSGSALTLTNGKMAMDGICPNEYLPEIRLEIEGI